MLTSEIKYRRVYNTTELQFISDRLSPLIEKLLNKYISIVCNNRETIESLLTQTDSAIMMRDVLMTEMNNSLEISRIIGHEPDVAISRATIQVNALYKLFINSLKIEMRV